METIEIRRNGSARIFLLVFTVLYGGFTYFILLNTDSLTIKVILGFIGVLLIIGIYQTVVELIKKEPIMRITKDAFEIKEVSKRVSFKWEEIKEWKMEKDDESNSQTLVIQTAEKVWRFVNMHWLDKKPEEIKKIITEYKGKSE